MPFLPAIIVVWGIFTAVFLALLAYNATLTRYEDDQLFLSDINQSQQQRQTSIVRTVNRTQPLVRLCGIASAVLGALIVGIWTWQAWISIHPIH